MQLKCTFLICQGTALNQTFGSSMLATAPSETAGLRDVLGLLHLLDSRASNLTNSALQHVDSRAADSQNPVHTSSFRATGLHSNFGLSSSRALMLRTSTIHLADPGVPDFLNNMLCQPSGTSMFRNEGRSHSSGSLELWTSCINSRASELRVNFHSGAVELRDSHTRSGTVQPIPQHWSSRTGSPPKT